MWGAEAECFGGMNKRRVWGRLGGRFSKAMEVLESFNFNGY